MKKIFLTTILFLLALSILAVEMDNITAPMIAPSSGFTLEQVLQAPTTVTYNAPAYTELPNEQLGNTEMYSYWAATDFAEDPFDGIMEVCVIGSPLPSPLMTLIAALGTLGIIYMCRLQSTKVDKSLQRLTQ